MRFIIALCALLAGTVSAQDRSAVEALIAAGRLKMERMYQCVPKDGNPYWRNRPCAEKPEDLIHVNASWAPKGFDICEQLKFIYRDENKRFLVQIK